MERPAPGWPSDVSLASSHLRRKGTIPEGLQQSGYFRAKIAQEKLIEDSPIPYSIVHATQFFEFVGRIADEATDSGTVRLPPVLF